MATHRVSALVTGGASGIGADVARLLGDRGVKVLTWDRAGGDVVCDITDSDAVDAAMTETVDRIGVPTRVVACAGIGNSGLLVDETRENWDRTLAVNLTGTWLTIRAAAAAMITADTGGSIVVVSSISGTVVDRNMGAYCASKAGADMLVKVAATEWGEHGIRVNAVGPGVTDTPMAAQATRLPGWVEGLTERTPLGALGASIDVAAAVADVLELQWVTGQIIHADGGLALHSPIDSYGQLQRVMRDHSSAR